MNAEQQQICRLCLKVTKNEFVKIDEILNPLFDILLLRLEIDIATDPIICQDCMIVAKKCLNFKYICIRAEQIILSYITDRREIKCNIKVIYEQEKHGCTHFDEDFEICRFCMTQLEKNNIVFLNTFMNESMLEMLSEYMTEMDIDNIENTLICTNCRENLDGYFKFVLNCLDSEEKLKAYCRENGTGSLGQVKLANVLQFMFTDILEYPDKSLETHTLCPQTSDPKQKNSVNRHIANHNNTLDPQSSISVDAPISKIKMDKRLFCGYESKEKSNVKDMFADKAVTEIKMYKCLMCSYEAKRKCDLTKHISSHKEGSKLKMYKCSLCAYGNKYRSRLKTHMLIHKDVSEIEMFKCSLCTYEAKYKGHLKKHMIIHKNVSEIKTYKCFLCGFESKHKGCLRNHMLIHKDVKEIEMNKCSLCDYEAKQKSDLKRHMLVHKDVSELEMYKCPWCEYEAKQQRYLNTHMLVHKDVSEVQMYKCSFCNYEAKQKCYVKRHMIVHKNVSEIKMFKCSLCAYETRQRRGLKTHMLVHTDFKETKMHKY